MMEDLSNGKKANHSEEQDAILFQEDSESDIIMPGVGDKYVQDWHAMVSKILEGFVDLCETGFMWDHFYQGQLCSTPFSAAILEYRLVLKEMSYGTQNVPGLRMSQKTR
jgi:hypothetical protein